VNGTLLLGGFRTRTQTLLFDSLRVRNHGEPPPWKAQLSGFSDSSMRPAPKCLPARKNCSGLFLRSIAAWSRRTLFDEEPMGPPVDPDVLSRRSK
jgi:hypothetical protein